MLTKYCTLLTWAVEFQCPYIYCEHLNNKCLNRHLYPNISVNYQYMKRAPSYTYIRASASATHGGRVQLRIRLDLMNDERESRNHGTEISPLRA